jgi:hypothetical protein
MNIPAKVQQYLDEIDGLSAYGCAIGLAFSRGTPRSTFFSYPDQFLAEYNQKNLARVDPTLRFGFQSVGIEQWKVLEENCESREAFTLARQFGILDGVCFSVSVAGYKTIASASQHPRQPFSEPVLERIHELLVLATVEVVNATQRPSYSELTNEWLALAIAGKSDTEVAEALGLSIHGARARRRNSLSEIGAKTPAQAIAIAHGI